LRIRKIFTTRIPLVETLERNAKKTALCNPEKGETIRAKAQRMPNNRYPIRQQRGFIRPLVRETLVNLVDAHRNEQNPGDQSPNGVVSFESHMSWVGITEDFCRQVKGTDISAAKQHEVPSEHDE